MDGRRVEALVERLRASPPLFVMHVNADPDCVASAAALREAFGGVVAAPEGVSRAGAAVARLVGLEPDAWAHPEKFETVVAVDTSSRSQLGRLGARVGDVCLVDHHGYGDLIERAPAAAWDPARASCVEVALALLDRVGHAPSERVRQALLCGLVADTASFRFADGPAFRMAARLVEAGASMEEALDVLARDPTEEEPADTYSQRHATLLAVQRATFERVGDYLVARSHVSTFDAAAAVALVRAGADLAVVANERGGRARMSLRASRRLLALDGVHLGEWSNEAARAAGWSGGGHAGAAGLSGAPPDEKAWQSLRVLVGQRLGGG